MPFVVKFQYQTDIRRVTAEKPLTWAEATEIVKTLFEISSRFTLKYKDDDGDLITVSTDRELEEAFQFMKDHSALRFTIVPQEQKKVPANSNNTDENEQVIDIDVGALLPVIQELIQTFAPQALRSPRCGRFGAGRPQQPSDAHVGVTCDGCGASPIRGIRWKCLVCPDYDLCEKCDKEGVHREHPFNKITEPISYFGGCPFRPQTVNVNNNSQEVVHSAYCDVCNNRIRGLRYKCSVCPDYDLCEKCEQSKETSHPGHAFNKITHPCQGRRCPRSPQTEAKKDEKPETTPLVPLRPAAVPVPIPIKVEKVEEKPVPSPSPAPAPVEQPKPEVQQPVPSSPVPEQKKEEPKPVEQPKVVEPVPVQPSPAPVQPQPQPSDNNTFQAKLKQLQDMGFADGRRNLEVLIKNRGDMIRSVMDLLNI